MKSKFLECSNGNKSSKRLNAAILLGVGIGMTVVSFIIALFRPLGDSKIIIELIAIVLGLGSGLSGVTIFDAIFSRKRERK
ncbi:hypothetical protein KY314_02940 [Candidatus Woesearchaeota archaeon]|nr:hypothetical protein [Candidatus Woesearchaeota archaeon]